MTRQSAGVAAALHATAGLPETWDEGAFATLLTLPGIQGCIVMDPGDMPLGLSLWRVAADEAELLTICVSPPVRRQGVGRALVDAALADSRARGAARLLLEVAADNPPARTLYDSLGFEACGRRPNYYRTASGPVDAEIMVKDLTRGAAQPPGG